MAIAIPFWKAQNVHNSTFVWKCEVLTGEFNLMHAYWDGKRRSLYYKMRLEQFAVDSGQERVVHNKYLYQLGNKKETINLSTRDRTEKTSSKM